MDATSRRWRGIATPSRRRSYGDDVASMAWGVRNLISTQALAPRLERAKSTEDDWGILGSAFRKAPVALVVVWVVVAVVATVAVHSVHCKLLWEHAPSSPRSPRTARRAEIISRQRRDLSP